MPLYKEVHINHHLRIGIWKVEETLDELYTLVPFSAAMKEQAEKQFHCLKRKIEFVAVRVLLYHLLKKKKEIGYYSSGRPYLLDASFHLSISHTHGYVALALSKEQPVGIDIERYAPKISKIKERILGVQERAESLYEILLHWSAKESVFKVLDTEGIDFSKHFRITHLVCNANELAPADEGTFKLEASFSGRNTVFDVAYFTESDFVLTYTGDFKTK